MKARHVPVLAWVVVLLGLGVGVLQYLNGDSSKPNAVLEAVAFAAPFVACGFVAVIGSRRKMSRYVLAAGVGLIVIAALSWSLFPLIFPAVLLIVGSASMQMEPRPGESFASALIAIGLVAGSLVLLVWDDPVTWTSPTGSFGSSDMVTALEAALTFTILSLVLVVALASPRERGRVRSNNTHA